jgi:hypothetical protein
VAVKHFEVSEEIAALRGRYEGGGSDNNFVNTSNSENEKAKRNIVYQILNGWLKTHFVAYPVVLVFQPRRDTECSPFPSEI